jgi:hypothetical protein
MNFLWHASTGILHGPAELVGKVLHDLLKDAGCSLCQLRYLHVQDILFSIFQGVQVSRYHLWKQLDIYPL